MTAQPDYHFTVHLRGNIGWILDRIEVGDQRDRDPIVAVDSLVPGNDGAQLARLAATQLDWRFSANALKIQCVVTSGINETKEAIRLFKQQGCLCMAAEGEKSQCCKNR